MEFVQSMFAFVEGFANSANAIWVLFVLAFSESAFFIIPPDVLLIPLAIASPANALFYSTIATVASVLGGVFGYYIGKWGGQPILHRFAGGKKINLIKDYYNRYDVWAIGVAAFTPIPYKVFVISAGVFGIDFKRFLLASAIGRGGRFYAVGLLFWLFGPTIKDLIEDYFEITLIAVTVLVIGSFLVMGRLAGNHGEFINKAKKNAS